MYNALQEDKLDDYRFNAGIHGVDLNEKSSTSSETEKSEDTASIPQFGDPKEYEHLSQEERELLTAKMKQKHTNWVNNVRQQ